MCISPSFVIFRDKCSVPENFVQIRRFPDKRVPNNQGLTVFNNRDILEVTPWSLFPGPIHVSRDKLGVIDRGRLGAVT